MLNSFLRKIMHRLFMFHKKISRVRTVDSVRNTYQGGESPTYTSYFSIFILFYLYSTSNKMALKCFTDFNRGNH